MPRQMLRWTAAAVLASVWLLAVTPAVGLFQEQSWRKDPRLPSHMGDPPSGVPPLHRLEFAHSPQIGTTAFAPDGSVLYVQIYPEVVNVWEVLVYLWPELLGGGVALIAVVVVLIAARVLRRPQRLGEMHCRRCNYNLSGLAASAGGADPRQKCPECGTDPAQRPPRIGRRMRRRLVPVLAPLVVVLVAYSAMWAAGLPRQGRASVWLIWPSKWVTEQATNRQIAWLAPFAKQHERIVAVDPDNGRVVRTVASRATPTRFPISVSPDGKWLLLSGGPGSLERVSTRSGSVRGSVAIPGPDSHRRMGGRDIVGYSSDGGSAYVVYADAPAVKTRVVRWDLATDEVVQILETSAYSDPKGRQGITARRVCLVPGETPRFVVSPSFKESYDTGKYTIGVHDPASGEVVREFGAAGSNLSSSYPVVSPNGERLYLSANVDGVQGFGLRTGETLGFARPDLLRDTGNDELLLSPSGDRLFFPVFRDSILVRSLAERRWVARLSAGGLIAPELAISNDGRWLAVVGFKRGGPTRGPYLHELLIHDLSELPRPEAADGAGTGAAPGGSSP